MRASATISPLVWPGKYPPRGYQMPSLVPALHRRVALASHLYAPPLAPAALIWAYRARHSAPMRELGPVIGFVVRTHQRRAQAPVDRPWYEGRSVRRTRRGPKPTLRHDPDRVRLTLLPRNPGMSKRKLAAAPAKAGIDYVHLPALAPQARPCPLTGPGRAVGVRTDRARRCSSARCDKPPEGDPRRRKPHECRQHGSTRSAHQLLVGHHAEPIAPTPGPPRPSTNPA
jgi:hypothetical protein